MNRQGGYTYVSVLILITALAISAQATWIPDGTKKQREDESELIFRGLAYYNAIESYYKSGDQNPTFPQRLEHLLFDPRDQTQRHIRRLYDSPIGDGGWELITAPGGGIAGVAPKSSSKPMKVSNFIDVISNFEGSENYSDWHFVFDPASEESKN